jgi:predicted DNA-binding antitoxin AbrB/MazE fold protein
MMYLFCSGAIYRYISLIATASITEGMMTTTVTAIYADGVLRPLTPLALPEQTTVQLSVQPVAFSQQSDHRLRIQQALTTAGIATEPHALGVNIGPLSVERRAELAQRFATQQPLSDVIAEEREGR